MTSTVTTTAPATPTRVRTALIWVVQVGLASQFVAGGLLKLAGDPQMTAMFAEIGAGQWLRFVVGVLELAGAVGLVVPRLAVPAAGGIVALMLGATATNIVVLGSSPVMPLVFLVLAVAVAALRRHNR